MSTKNDHNIATFLHLSTLTQYALPVLGSFIFPVIIWSSCKDRSTYIDNQGKQCINFQLSMFTYTLILALIAIPTFIVTVVSGFEYDHFYHSHFDGDAYNGANVPAIVAVLIVTAVLFVILMVAEFFLIIYAAVKTSHGEDFKYPMTIPFLKYTPIAVAAEITDHDAVETAIETEA